MMTNISQNLTNFKHQLATNNANAKLIAVSKTMTSNIITLAYQAGQTDFAENYPQELVNKAEELKDLPITWHFIGNLQSNKTKVIATYCTWLHTLCKLQHAKRLNEQRPANLPPLNVLLEVQISDESTKHGLQTWDEIYNLALAIEDLPALRLCGLMGMASNTNDQNIIKIQFQQLAAYQERLKALGFKLTELSMGMSNDYQLALECGATMLRIGSKIFGARK